MEYFLLITFKLEILGIRFSTNGKIRSTSVCPMNASKYDNRKKFNSIQFYVILEIIK